MSNDFRIQTSEVDLSLTTTTTTNVTGAMVVISPKGRGDKPIHLFSESDVTTNLTLPTPAYPSLYEAVAYTRSADLWAVCAIGSGALYGGMDVTATGASAFVSGVVDTASYAPGATVSHTFFASSQYTDDLKMDISHVSGVAYQFSVTLYQKNTKGVYQTINTYDYSLIQEKDAYGQSLYIMDVFNDNAYVIPKINPTFTLSTTVFNSFVNTTNIVFAGGNRGATPTTAEINTAWDLFKQVNKYKVALFMDVFGTSTSYVNTICTTYQPYAHVISVVPIGKTSAAQCITARNALSLDSDHTSLYCNWTKIQEPYQGGYVYISNVGSIGRRYVAAAPSFNFESPAGINQNGYGGQLSDWSYVESEMSFTTAPGGETYLLDQAQVNPVILDPVYGLMIYGDKTLQITLSDTSYVGARRGYNYIIENIETQVLRRLPFKVNTPLIQTQTKILVENILQPILAGGYLREVLVVCDSSNNTDATLARREFHLDLYEKIAPNIQKVIFQFVKMGQTISVQDLTK